MKAIRLGLLISLIVTMSTACASTGAAPPLGMTTTTLMAGWEQHFMVEWAAAEQSPNARKVTGYVYNRHGEYASDLRLLAQALDSSGAVVGQRIAWVPGGLGGSGRAYFEVPNLPVRTRTESAFETTPGSKGPKTGGEGAKERSCLGV